MRAFIHHYLYRISFSSITQTKTNSIEPIHKETKVSDNAKYLIDRNKGKGEPSKLKEVYNSKDPKV